MSIQITEIDPTLLDGFRIVYERDVHLEVRHGFSEAVGTLQTLRLKVFVLYDNNNNNASTNTVDGSTATNASTTNASTTTNTTSTTNTSTSTNVASVRVELLSEHDLFFYYIHNLDIKGYNILSGQQKLQISFQEYAQAIIRTVDKCIAEPASHLGILYVEDSTATARLDFIHNMQFKFIELLSLTFHTVSDEELKRKIIYRYTDVKAALQAEKQKLADVLGLVKVKNPSLILQMQKTILSAKQRPSSSGASATVSSNQAAAVQNNAAASAASS